MATNPIFQVFPGFWPKKGRFPGLPGFSRFPVTLHWFTCNSGYLLYKLRCKGCNDYYIGRTNCLRERLANHKLKTYNANYRLQKMYIHIFDCAKKHKVTEEPFTIIPFLKLHYDKISEMEIVEKHLIDWLKPGLNTLI